jgi:DNA-binding Lrp family transcriptional regulator
LSVERLRISALEAIDDASVARVVARFSGEYVLRAFQLLIDMHGDIRAGLIAQAIQAANTAHLDARTEEGRRAGDPEGVIPDSLRRPVGIARLADSTGLPFESTRRIVQRLVDSGVCVRVKGGVMVPAAVVRRPEMMRAVIANAGYVRRLVRDLRAVGLVQNVSQPWEDPAEETDPALARIIARLSAAYLLRALQLLAETSGDIRAGIIAQTIVTANTAHLDARDGEGMRYAGLAETTPDALRKPISIARLAGSLGLPYETMRGQVRRMIEAGLCARVDGGLIVPSAVLERPEEERATLANVGYVRRFVRDLQAAEP